MLRKKTLQIRCFCLVCFDAVQRNLIIINYTLLHGNGNETMWTISCVHASKFMLIYNCVPICSNSIRNLLFVKRVQNHCNTTHILRSKRYTMWIPVNCFWKLIEINDTHTKWVDICVEIVSSSSLMGIYIHVMPWHCHG